MRRGHAGRRDYTHCTCKLLADRVSNEHRAIPVVAAVSNGLVERSCVEIDGIVKIEHQRRRRLPVRTHTHTHTHTLNLQTDRLKGYSDAH